MTRRVGTELLPVDDTGDVEIAVLTDVHGNSVALDAVTADARTSGVERFWVLGDLVAMGPDPIGTIERLQALEPEVMIRGNTDRYVLHDENPFPPVDELPLESALVEEMVEIAACISWTKGMLTAAGQLDWLGRGRDNHGCPLPDGTSLLAVHASLHRDDGRGIDPEITDDDLRALFPGVNGGVVLGGHTHHATDRIVGQTRFVNPGSVSNHLTDDRRARYLLLRADDHGVEFEHRAIDYDVEAAKALFERFAPPGRASLVERFFS